MSDICTIFQATERYVRTVEKARSSNTVKTYRNGLRRFLDTLYQHKIHPERTPITDLREDSIAWLADALKLESPSTERLYLTAVSGFFQYLAAENLAEINLPRVRLLIRQRSRRPGVRLPQFPKEDIEKVLKFVSELNCLITDDESEKLRNMRDRAFLLTLADTGLRVHEACGLRRGDVDWHESRAIVIGKGDKQAVVRFSRRSQSALKEYLQMRSHLDGSSGKPLGSLPLFARHDKGAGKKVKPITTTTGRNIVSDRVTQCLGLESVGRITPHSFRHYFVTRVLQGSGNLKLAQELARHSNIAVTQRYAHLNDDELDKGYWDVFEEE